MKTAWTLLMVALAAGSGQASQDLESCLQEQGLVQVARVVGPDGKAVHARVVAQQDGLPSAFVSLDGAGDLATVFERAADTRLRQQAWRIGASERAERICAPLALPQQQIDAESRVVVAAGLNYAAHAEEAGGGDVFLFPKPVSPGAPYGPVAAPAGVTLLDYEVELGFVLLADVDLRALPSREELLARSAFFVANDITDREPIIRNATLSGPGTGFVEAKGQPGFLPAGPWLVRGSEVFAALAACGQEGLGLRLDVDEGRGFQPRQSATTAAMILEPRALLERIAADVTAHGRRSPMPVRRSDGVRHYPLAVAGPGDALRLPEGSVVLTGTPEGVAIQAPAPLGVLLRGLLRLRSPFEQFRREELERVAAGGAGGYLAPGDRVRASIDGLGSQIFEILAPGASPRQDPCAASSWGQRPAFSEGP